MKTTPLRLFAVAAALAALITGCSRKSEAAASASAPAAPNETANVPAPPPAPAPAASTEQRAPEKRLPRLVDIGAGTCIPCKMMAPILAELKRSRAHEFETVFVDLNHEREKGLGYGIRVIPTQIFFDERGRELFRHEGFISKEDILRTWSGFGYHFDLAN